jgi:hypothetical protein
MSKLVIVLYHVISSIFISISGNEMNLYSTNYHCLCMILMVPSQLKLSIWFLIFTISRVHFKTIHFVIENKDNCGILHHA